MSESGSKGKSSSRDHAPATCAATPKSAPTGNGLRVLVCGGRQFEKPRVVGRELARLHQERPISLIITGGANGADWCAGRWAEHNRIALCVFPANWQFDGRAAGPIRNGRALQFAKPDLVVAFPGGPGTLNMIAQAERAGVPVVRADWSDAGSQGAKRTLIAAQVDSDKSREEQDPGPWDLL